MNNTLLEEIAPRTEPLNSISRSVLRTLLYFDIFHHPLTAEEVHRYLNRTLSGFSDTELALINLCSSGYVRNTGKYFFVGNDIGVIQRREKGEEKSEKVMQIAKRFSNLIAHFPFVEGICLSGSLAKGYMDNKTDIDYFIITKPNRLWLCRTFLIIFKKIFLLNSKKYFCLNYFIDTCNLEIPDKNIFTATEIIFIIPTYNEKLYTDFINANSWVNRYYPNFQKSLSGKIFEKKSLPMKSFLENLFSKKLGEKLDLLCFKITLKYWKKKFKNFDEGQFDLNLRSRKNVSKHHPNGFQEKILDRLKEKIIAFEKEFDLILN